MRGADHSVAVVAAAVAARRTDGVDAWSAAVTAGEPDDAAMRALLAQVAALRHDVRVLGGALRPDAVAVVHEVAAWLDEQARALAEIEAVEARVAQAVRAVPAADALVGQELVAWLRHAAGQRRRELRDALLAAPGPEHLEALAAADLGVVAGASGERAADLFVRRLRRERRHLRARHAELGRAPAPAALDDFGHHVRRLHATAVLAGPVLGPDAALVAALAARVDTELTVLHDSDLAEAWLREQAPDTSHALAFVVGELVGLERAARREAQRRWPAAWRALRAAPAWEDLRVER